MFICTFSHIIHLVWTEWQSRWVAGRVVLVCEYIYRFVRVDWFRQINALTMTHKLSQIFPILVFFWFNSKNRLLKQSRFHIVICSFNIIWSLKQCDASSQYSVTVSSLSVMETIIFWSWFDIIHIFLFIYKMTFQPYN